MLLEIHDGSLSVGGKLILSHVDFEIKGNEKIAIVGRNGAGKTTLLRLLAGELELDADDKRVGVGMSTSRSLTVGMLRQKHTLDWDKTVEELILEGFSGNDRFSKERFFYEMEYDRIFTGLGFAKEAKHKRLKEFSGGEQTKIALIRLLLQRPDILLLDEPTNHLDLKSLEWLETYLRSYEKAIVFVSHDRFFLDQVVEICYELEEQSLTRYAGNYTAYRMQKKKDIALQWKKYESQQTEIKRLNQLIEQFKHKPKKAAFARSRKTILERMEKVERPREEAYANYFCLTEPLYPGNKIMLEAEELKAGYDKVLCELTLRIKRGQRIAIIGDNGVGKTTLLKTLAGKVSPLGGELLVGEHALIGYFDQQLKEESGLSGGEQARMLLKQLLEAGPNLLLLDEPTNHMDIPTKESLEQTLQKFAGAIVMVSHDRYFVNQVADAILLIENNKVYYYPFGYQHYLSKVRDMDATDIPAMVQAKDQALVEGLKAVPRAERHRLREINTEEAYVDWQLRLLAEPMLKTKELAENAYQKIRMLEEQLPIVLWTGSQTEYEVLQNNLKEAQEAYASLETVWTAQCIAWYEFLQPFLVNPEESAIMNEEKTKIQNGG